jgi:hypothetical protein
MRDLNPPLLVYVAIGVIVLWCKTSKTNRNIYGLSPVLELFFGDGHLRSIIELIIFIVLGCLVSDGLVVPTTAAQAIAAGLGWTGLMTK